MSTTVALRTTDSPDTVAMSVSVVNLAALSTSDRADTASVSGVVIELASLVASDSPDVAQSCAYVRSRAGITLAQYTQDEHYVPIDGGTGRLINFQPFVPPAVQIDHCRWRPKTASEFDVYIVSLLAGVSYQAAWVAETDAPSGCTVGRCPTEPLVIQAGLIYRDANTFGVWTGESWTIVRPGLFNIFPDWMKHPSYNSPISGPVSRR